MSLYSLVQEGAVFAAILNVIAWSTISLLNLIILCELSEYVFLRNIKYIFQKCY